MARRSDSGDGRIPAVMGDLERRAVNRFPNRGGTYTNASSYLDGSQGGALRRAIDQLYAAFSGASLSSPLKACAHCFTSADIEYLRTTPVKSLNHGDLYLIATKLVTTLGEERDIAYFVPRLIEAMAEGARIDVLPLAHRLAGIPAQQWDVQKEAALRDCFQQLFAATKDTPDDLALDCCRTDLLNAFPRIFREYGT